METILKKLTKERYNEAMEIINTINPKEPKYKQSWKLAQAYKIFGINCVWNERHKSIILSLCCKDASTNNDKSINTGASMELKPFDYAKNIAEQVISFRLYFMDYHRNRPDMLNLMEK